MTPAEMTMDECGELLRYVRGAEFSDEARSKLYRFLHERGWLPPEERAAALAVAQRRWDARSKYAKMGSRAYCDLCGERSIGVRRSGGSSCRAHWDLEQTTPVFDAATGFPLSSSTVSRELNDEQIKAKHRAQFAPKYCVYCGATATCLAKGGFWACDEHRTEPKPVERILRPHFMWTWKSGHRCEVCDRPATGIHQRNGKDVGYFCQKHFPVGVPTYSSGPVCQDCGEEATVLDRAGVWRCDAHRLVTQSNIPPSTLPETTAS
jgi:hypothetical protein